MTEITEAVELPDVRETLGLAPPSIAHVERFGPPLYTAHQVQEYAAALLQAAREEASQGAGEPVAVEYGDRTETCERCKGNGELVTDWERYLGTAHPGDTGDEGTADCPACDGIGKIHPPPNPQARIDALEGALETARDALLAAYQRTGHADDLAAAHIADAALSPVQAVKGDGHG